jgi:hypothetical protein
MGGGGEAPSRYEVNRNVRTILTCHSFDLQLVAVSCSTTIVYLTGSLKKAPDAHSQLTPAHIEALLKDIRRLPYVRGVICDLENWTITNIDGSWQISPKKEQARLPHAVSSSERS